MAPFELNLGPVAENGGPTQTNALGPGSVAIDAVTDCTDIDGNSVLEDQRGVSRPQGSACDVGAFEAQPVLAIAKELTSNSDEDESGSVSVGDTLTFTITASNFGPVALTEISVSDPSLDVLDCAPPLPATRPPGGTVVCTGDYAVTYDDARAGEFVNIASANSAETEGVSDKVVTPVDPTPCGEANHLVLEDQTISVTQEFIACFTILGGNGFEVGSDGDVTFRAGESVVLQNGFWVASGGSFEVVIDPTLTDF